LTTFHYAITIRYAIPLSNLSRHVITVVVLSH